MSAVAFTPTARDRQRRRDGTVRLWDAASGRRARAGTTPGSSAVAFSPDGATIASAVVHGRAAVGRGDRYSRDACSRATPTVVSAVAFSPDGANDRQRRRDETVRLWDAASGAAGRVLRGHTDWVSAVAFSPDGETIASAGDDGTVRLWDAASGAARARAGGPHRLGERRRVQPRRPRRSPAPATTGRCGCGTRRAAPWAACSKDHTGWVSAVAFSPDGADDRQRRRRQDGAAVGRGERQPRAACSRATPTG